jgi:hypothetical protein
VNVRTSRFAFALTLAAGIALGWLARDGIRPALAAIQGQALATSGKITAIATCFGTVSPPAGWSTAPAVATALAAGNYRIVAGLAASGPSGCANPQIVWAEAP